MMKAMILLAIYLVGVAVWVRLRDHVTEQTECCLKLFCSAALGCLVWAAILLFRNAATGATGVASTMTIVSLGLSSIVPIGILNVILMDRIGDHLG